MRAALPPARVAGPIPPGTPDWVVAHARAQQRHFRWCEAVHRWLPRAWHARAGALVAQQLSPELPLAAKIWCGLRAFTGCSEAEAHRLLDCWFANQGQFAVALHDYPRLDAAWARAVDCDHRAQLAELAARGGLVITCHSFHHNRSGAFFGLSGTRVWGIAATEENSLWKPWTARWVRAINGGSESHFGGGTYLYTDALRQLLTQSREGLQRGDTVVTLCDNDAGDGPGSVRVTMAGRALRVATGLIELAEEVGAPIHFALFHGDLAGGHRCRLAPAPQGGRGVGLQAIAQAYVDQILAWCRDTPWAWQGWMWWDDLPAAEPGVDLGPARAQALERFEATRPAPGLGARLLQRAAHWEARRWPALP